jgi:hypothetical protein
MVNFKNITPAKFGEAGFGSQWSKFEGSFRGSMFNAGSETLYERMYDFSSGDRIEWTWDDGVTFGDLYAYIPEGKQIRKDGMTFPSSGNWKITLSIGGGAFLDGVRIGLIDTEGSLLYREFDEESINAGRVSLANVEYDNGLERVYIYEANKPKSPFIDAKGKTFTGIYIQCTKGSVVLKTVFFDWMSTDEIKVMQHSNITITDFNAGGGGGHAGAPQSTILTNRKVSTISESFVPGLFPSQSSLVFNTDTPEEHYGLNIESVDTLNISSRIRLQAPSHLTIGLSTFMIEIEGTETRVLDGNGNILRDSILTLPSPTETILVNFVKRDEDISCRIDLEDPQKLVSEPALYTGGLFNYPHRNPGTLYKLENRDSSNLYLDYILCGDQLWEPFM